MEHVSTHVSNPVKASTTDALHLSCLKMNSPADERTKLKVIYCFKTFLFFILVVPSLNLGYYINALKQLITSCRSTTAKVFQVMWH